MIRSLLLLAATSSTLTAGSAGTIADRNCQPFSRLLSPAVGAERGVGFRINQARRGDVVVDGQPTLLSNANECDFDPGTNETSLECTWQFENETVARSFHGALRRNIAACLPEQLVVQDPPGNGGGNFQHVLIDKADVSVANDLQFATELYLSAWHKGTAKGELYRWHVTVYLQRYRTS